MWYLYKRYSMSIFSTFREIVSLSNLIQLFHFNPQNRIVFTKSRIGWFCRNDYVFDQVDQIVCWWRINTLRPRQNGRHFPDDILRCIFLNENLLISIKISLKFVPNGPINNIPVLVQIIAWRRTGDKPLSETMITSLPTHICVTRPQWLLMANNEVISVFRSLFENIWVLLLSNISFLISVKHSIACHIARIANTLELTSIGYRSRKCRIRLSCMGDYSFASYKHEPLSWDT